MEMAYPAMKEDVGKPIPKLLSKFAKDKDTKYMLPYQQMP